MKIPSCALYCLEKLRLAGYEAQVVGGCVRDSLRGITPHDWDICTSAMPEEMLAVFQGDKVIPTGLKHGTLTVLVEGEPLEITTYRTEGNYSDHRRPDSVNFVRSLREDMARRDFTINAMGLRSDGELVDFFGGQQDLQARLIRCVGDPEKRFGEDALRILRGLRFASQLDFIIHPDTKAAMLARREELSYVSAERIKGELDKLLIGPGAVRVLRENIEVIGEVIPELLACVGFEQHTPYHHLDVWEHTLTALEACPPDPVLRWAVLLHDVGKPPTFFMDRRGGHFYGHAETGARMARTILARLKSDRASREDISLLVAHHGDLLAPQRKYVLRRLNKLGEENLRRLIWVQRCDLVAHAPRSDLKERLEELAQFERELETVLADGSCFSRQSLALTGRDLIEAGIPKGKEVGRILDRLLSEVMEGSLENRREALLLRAEELRKKP